MFSKTNEKSKNLVKERVGFGYSLTYLELLKCVLDLNCYTNDCLIDLKAMWIRLIAT